MDRYSRKKMASAIDHVIKLHREAPDGLADFQLRKLFEETWPDPCCDHLYQQARSAARDLGKIRDSGRELKNPDTDRDQIVWEYYDGQPIEVPQCPLCGAVRRNRKKKAAVAA